MNMLAEEQQRREDADELTFEMFGGTIELLANISAACAVARDAIVECGRLRADRDYWRDKYNESLRESINHGDAMMGTLLKATLQGNLTASGRGDHQ